MAKLQPFLREKEGLIIGYVETDDLHEAAARVAAFEVNTRWQAAMAEYFDNGGRPPDSGFEPLVEYFHLD